ncbi:hypothetical protein N7452_008479 [Penicillium brevicompactum]|uniref:Apple domain-containing protein n=1 Tax=Penicillium brevicompactum TaxID=5074 RepID=A0A9W9Q870_PENBR|nr:hypothetical protein N7452_008479 [Penicillium brevicompactum]
MKLNSVAFLGLALIQAPGISAQCIEGEKQHVVPDYRVLEECAQKCKDANTPHCAYSPDRKGCVVGREGDVLKQLTGAYTMERIADDPDDGEGFPDLPADCEDEKAACEKEKIELQKKTATCPGDPLRDTCNTNDKKEIYDRYKCNQFKVYCDRHHDTSNPKVVLKEINFNECIDLCSQRTACTYALWSAPGGKNPTCQLYERKVAYTTTPGIVDPKWWTFVKKP